MDLDYPSDIKLLLAGYEKKNSIVAAQFRLESGFRKQYEEIEAIKKL